ncbi:C4-dicarboxylate transporter DcuC [Pasteurella multocida]|uniref:C4-dicarboxylate transporter DcuC n=1 Tax=Pasteurella multocida TaxID=747 RepID=UPI000E051623|nr:C4-dicarboxylate transporter DcuC [Pasteurella multocida]MCL7786179.1 C4-dicarboxylate transporter DcuC [Pasteurella multocida]MCL7795539.1 C4-dicarboxylate transporter DcuC [Pasteurella multocida]MCL7818553.1 C4-dicarboxylate transporter DcuC [Pasteurella multocida]MEB3451688.1 C4-dicarboxylate transporter DcuC [Pasteurella multocida]MEB3453239.1 C4-dicarboxylate transporter DcuC [Pasteurella multocida]
MLGLLLGLAVTILVGYLIVKKYKAQFVLLCGGIILMCFAVLFGLGEILPANKSTGWVGFDIFEFIKNLFSTRAADLGLMIMAVGGFARYMDKIGASEALVNIAVKPLNAIKAPYLVLALAYIVGQILNIFIPSASGLGLLLMLTIFPILVNLGVSREGAAALIATTACLDLGPASGNAVLAAKTANIDIAEYFVGYQLKLAIITMLVISTSHFFVQKWFDKRQALTGGGSEYDASLEVNLDKQDKQALPVPAVYVLLPLLPLVLILTFSKLLVSSIKMNVATAMIISLFIAMLFEFVRKKDVKQVFAEMQVFFDGMGKQFAAVVTLIVAGETFAKGLTAVGAIDTIISGAQTFGFGVFLMTLVMVLIIALSAIVMGSGNAPFFAFAALAPKVASGLGISPVLMVLPMQLVAGIARSMSPITAVIVAVSGVANVSPFDLIKRTALPMAFALITVFLGTFLLYH